MHDQLPPHDEASEKALVGCVLLAGCRGATEQVDAILKGVKASVFFGFASRAWRCIQQLREHGNTVDFVTMNRALRLAGLTVEQAGEVMTWQDLVASELDWTTHKAILEDLHRRRLVLKLAHDAAEMARNESIDPTGLRADLARIIEGVTSDVGSERPRCVVRKSSERLVYEPPPGVDLVGDAEIGKGTEAISILAGPGSSGKSLLAGNLALAGAIGSGTWMGRKVHRKFKTLILQGEVGPRRMKSQMQQFAKLHPEADIENCIFYSDPPEFGFSIDDAKFWHEFSRIVKELKPDLVVVDPISHLSVEDQASEVMNAIRVIRQAVGVGDDAPGIMFIAHTKKPRSEEAMRGRNLANMVSGSVAWVNTSRCTYLCVPFDADDITDDRILFSTPKLNDGANYAPTVWKRKFGTFFEHDPNTDPRSWGRAKTDDERAEERWKITVGDLKAAFGDRPGMKRAELVRALVAAGHDEATCYRATKEPDGYLMRHLHVVAGVYCMK